MDFPDSPEAVALVLFRLVLSEAGQVSGTQTKTAWMLDLFAECLKAARGQRHTQGATQH